MHPSQKTTLSPKTSDNIKPIPLLFPENAQLKMSRKRRNDNQNPDDDDGVDEGAEAVSTTTEQSTTKTTTMGGVLGATASNRSNNTINPRRMVRARRPEDSSRTNSTGFGGGMGNSPPNFFANVRLSTGSTIPTTTTTTVATSFPGILATKNNNNNNINNNKLKEFCEWKLAQDKAFIEKMEEGDLGCHDQTNVIWEYMYHRRLKEYKQRTVNGSNQQEAADGISNTSTTNPHKRNKDSTTSASASSGLQNNNKNSTNNDNNAPALSFGSTSSSQAPPKLSFGFPSSSSSSVTAPSNPLFGFGQSSTQKTTTTTSSTTTSASSLAPFSFTAPPGGGGFSFTPSSNSGTEASTTAIGTSSTQGKISFGTTTLTETEEKTNLTSSSTNESNDQAPEGEDLDKVQKANDKYWKDIETSPAVRIYHQDDPSVRDSPWKSFASGALYLQVKKDDSTAHRIVMRSSSGQNVLVNMKIFKDMTFLLSTERNSKAGSSSNKEFGIISFRGTNDIKRGMESFKLKAAKEAAEILYQQLQASVAVSK